MTTPKSPWSYKIKSKKLTKKDCSKLRYSIKEDSDEVKVLEKQSKSAIKYIKHIKKEMSDEKKLFRKHCK